MSRDKDRKKQRIANRILQKLLYIKQIINSKNPIIIAEDNGK